MELFRILVKLQKHNKNNCIIYAMSKRVTIMLDDDLAKKVHEIQAKLIRESSQSVSFSSVMNKMIRENFKKP